MPVPASEGRRATGARRRAARAVAVGVLGLGAAQAQAAGIPFATDRPQSWQFSSDFDEAYSSFGQNLQWNDDSRAYDSQGHRVAGAGTDTFVGLSTLVRYWKIDGLPHVGFNANLTVPLVRIQGNQFAASGVGDPLLGLLTWYNPKTTTTLGMQAYVQVPVGQSSVTTNTWSFWPSVFYDDWFGHVNVDLLVGGILRGRTQRTGANDLDGGDTFHVNFRLGYSISPPDRPFAIPFLSMDYQRTGGTTDHTTGLAVPNSSNRETTVGAGVLFQLKPGSLPFVKQKTYDQFSIQYSHGIAGRNTGVTNGIFLQGWHYW